MALAMATSRLSVSMIGVPSAACSAKSFSPGWISGTFGNSEGTVPLSVNPAPFHEHRIYTYLPTQKKMAPTFDGRGPGT